MGIYFRKLQNSKRRISQSCFFRFKFNLFLM